MSTINTKSAKFTFNASDRLGAPTEETLKSVTVVPVNNTGEYHVLNFGLGFPVLRGWLNAVRDYLVLDEYLFHNDNRVHLYRPNNPNRVSGEMGWVHESAVRSVIRGTCSSQVQINGTLATVKLPTWRDSNQVAQVDIRSDWMFLKQRFAGEYALSNASIDDFSGECFASLKHNAIMELLNGVAVTIPVTVKVREDGSLGLGLQTKAQKMYQELQLLDAGDVDQETLRAQAYGVKMAFRNEQSIDASIERETEYIESLPEEEKPEPVKVAKTVTVDGKSTPLSKIKGLYKVWPVASDGKRMSRAEVPFIRFNGEGDPRLIRYARASFDLEALS